MALDREILALDQEILALDQEIERKPKRTKKHKRDQELQRKLRKTKENVENHDFSLFFLGIPRISEEFLGFPITDQDGLTQVSSITAAMTRLRNLSAQQAIH